MADGAAHPFTASKRAYRLRVIGIWSAVLLVALGTVFYFTRSRQSALVIVDSAPSTLTITLNGNPVSEKSDPLGVYIPVYAGRYRLQITKPGVVPFTQDITIPASTELHVRPLYTILPTTSQANSGEIAYVRSSSDQKSIYFLGNNRTTLYKMDTGTQTQQALTTQPLGGVTDVEWSLNPDVALVVQNDGVYLQELLSYNFQTQALVKIGGTDFISPVFDPNNSDRIATAYFPATGEKSLVLADKQFTTLERKASLSGFSNPKLVWAPNSKYIAVINQSGDTTQNNLWLFTLADGTFRSLTTSGSIVNANFSPDGKTILYETAIAGDHELHVYSIDSASTAATAISGTIATSAWKDNDSFYLPEINAQALYLYTTDGQRTEVPYAFPNTLTVEGMYYFSATQTLVFYTHTAVYTVNLTR